MRGAEVWLLCRLHRVAVFHAIGISLVWVSFADPENLRPFP